MSAGNDNRSEAPAGDESMIAIVQEFLDESYENLDQLDRDLVELEQNPAEQSLLSGIFRIIHTIKGNCGFFGYSKLETIAHVGENLLSRLRDGDLTLNPEITSALLAMVDAIRHILNLIETTQGEGDDEYSGLVETLSRLQKDAHLGAPQTPAAQPGPAAVEKGGGKPTLFERQGGEAALGQVVDAFYGRVLKDARIAHFFDGVDPNRLAAKQKMFMAYALGGVDTYSGKNLTEAHKPLVNAGLDDSHFDAVVENLLATLMQFNVSAGSASRQLVMVLRTITASSTTSTRTFRVNSMMSSSLVCGREICSATKKLGRGSPLMMV
jgi:two-component system chemotaxis sensor kinase CheA